MKLPLSAIVVGYNEAELLKASISKLSFCDEILYFDLGSSDNSMEIAKESGAQIIRHDKVDSCEWIHASFAKTTRHDWLLITDPDEVLSDKLIAELVNMFSDGILNENIGAVTAPWWFYFKNKKLFGTNWGGVNRRILLVHNKRFEFVPLIHAGRNLLDGYQQYDIQYGGENFIHHYWMNGYRKLFEKHRRYLKHEGEARYKTGRRVSLKGIILQLYRSFKYSYLTKKGFKDGFAGLFLSLFWAWYEFSANLETFKYQLAEKRASVKSGY